MKRLLTTCVFASLALAGCAHHPDNRLQGNDFEGRLHAARDLSNYQWRNDAYSAIAYDATRDNNITVGLSAIQEISEQEVRNQSAVRCARWCNEMGLKESAAKFAEFIMDHDLRNNVLKQVASNQ